MSEGLADADDIEQLLTARGFLTVRDWGGFPTQVTGRIPPEGKWFYYRERSGCASIEIYPAGRYPFAAPDANAVGGWDAASLGDEPPTEWEYSCDTPAFQGTEAALTEMLVLRFIEMWRSGTPRND